MIELSNVKKSFFLGKNEIKVLKGINLNIKSGDFVTIMGSSGSGKTTLLNIIGCLDNFNSGTYTILGKNFHKMSYTEQAFFRRKNIGFVFQMFNLIPRLNSYRNIELPLIYSGVSKKTRCNMVHQALKKVGLESRMDHKPSQLSGGQQQRVAIARALVNKPSILVADEPTGNLDSATSIEVMKLFKSLNKNGLTIIMVTHEKKIALFSKKVIHMSDGLIDNYQW